MTIDADTLLHIGTFADLAEHARAWIAERSTERRLDDGEIFVRPGDPADHLYYVLEGRLDFEGEIGGQPIHFVFVRGEVSGLLPHSRMTSYPSLARATGPTWLGMLHKEHFPELERVVPALAPRLLAIMTRRIRDAAHAQEQNERLSALGRLSAGLAHELNNPAAAARRAAAELQARLDDLPALLGRWLSCQPTPEQLGALERLVVAASRDVEALSPLRRSEREDEITDWLAELDVPDPEERAATFVDAGLRPEDLARLAPLFPEGLAEALAYLEHRLASMLLLHDVRASSGRISDLVSSIKNYSHMDRGGDRQPTDVRRGLDSTVTMLAHKLRAKRIQVERDFPETVRPVQADEGALNQVWTNLIDNAVHALHEGGRLTLKVREGPTSLLVSVIDDGPGIPDEAQSRVFEPFYTTKPVGEGTGLGLDMVQRIVARQHGGAVRLTSEPGRTEFLVTLPTG